MDQKEEHKIDFIIPGQSNSVVKNAEHFRVQELVKKIESHPHRAALRADLQQNNVYANRVMWSYSSCAKLHQKYDVPNVFFIGNQGIVSCGQCLIYSEFYHT